VKHPIFKLVNFSYLILFFISNSTSAGGYTELPRNLGPFELGMQKSEFIRIAKIKPEACTICINNEYFATISADKLNQLNAGDTGGDGADFFFYDDQLYHIAAGTPVRDLFLAKQDFEHQFSGPGKPTTLENGSAALIWEDNGTLISVNYRADADEVFSVNYYDWNLKEERDWRESLEPNQNANLNKK